METGPPINLQPQVQQTQPEPPQNNPIMQAIRIRINLDIVWLVAKLCLAVIIFSRNGTWARTIFLGAVATILFLFQTGAIGIPTLAQPIPIPNANANANQQGVEQIQAQPQPRTLLGFISWVVFTFFTSMVPQAEQPQ